MSTLPDQPDSGASSFPRGPELPDELPTQGGETLLFRRYRVIRELGRGGMGVVLLAHDTALEIPVAVKLVPDLVVKDTEAIADLRKEVLRGMALAHPGIVRTHNFERDETGAGIVMEYIEGHTLHDLKLAQPGGCFDPDQILPWLDQLCSVLDYAHRDARIVHRDLKPRNLMLTESGRLKVADFGIAAVLSDSISRHSMEGKVSGTLSYMSPQQAEGKRPSYLDDIHALGATLYDLLTGKPPFFRGNPATILAQIITLAPPSMTERREDLEVTGKAPLPPLWEEVIAACLAKDPTQRPQSAGEVLARLRATSPVHAIPAPRPLHPPAPAPASAPIDEAAATLAAPLPDPTPAPARRVQRSPAKSRARRWLSWAAVVCVPLLALLIVQQSGGEKRPLTSVAPATDGAHAQPLPATSATPAPATPPREAAPIAMSEPPRTAATPAPTPLPTPAPTPRPTPPPTPTPPPATPAPPPTVTPASATKDRPFVNSLGMEFVPAGSAPMLMSRWETRMKDYTVFAMATQRPLPPLGSSETGYHPVARVSWDDATAFCQWLSKKEGLTYRLPTDLEWSAAAGLPFEPGATPEKREGYHIDAYPWGGQWPPPADAGNYARGETRFSEALPGNDGFVRSAPVGSFRANHFGLYDLGGNVSEWVEDLYNGKDPVRVHRGANFMFDSTLPAALSSSFRDSAPPSTTAAMIGFRVLLEPPLPAR